MRVDLRKTHPNLYRTITICGCFNLALAWNFFFEHPTFKPLGIPNVVVGAIFLVLGVSLLVFLNVVHRLRLIRAVMACQISFLCFWALANTQQFWANKSSAQLPLLCLWVSFLVYPMLIEPPVNPVTEKPE